MPYDVTLGGISFVSYEQDFVETVGSEYDLVGSAVLPGAPRPLSFYNVTIPIHGDWTEVDPVATGKSMRLQIRSLLQNATQRFRGLQFTTTFDSDLDGWLVIGSADIGYGEGGPGYGDFVLRIQGAALIPAQQTFLLRRLSTVDRRLTTTALDSQMRVFRKDAVTDEAVDRHYFPVGSQDLIGQAEPRFVPSKPYATIFGSGPVVESRPHGETVRFDVPFADIGKGDVRIFDRAGHTHVKFNKDGDADPQTGYGWVRAFGPSYPIRPGDVPVLDNGRCRVRYTSKSSFEIDVADGDSYSIDAQRVSLGYESLVAAHLQEWAPERAVVRASFRGDKGIADVLISLQQGWEGPEFDINRHGDLTKPKLVTRGKCHRTDEGSWTHLRVGAEPSEALFDTRAHTLLGLH